MFTAFSSYLMVLAAKIIPLTLVSTLVFSPEALADDSNSPANLSLPPPNASFTSLAKTYPIKSEQIDLGEGFTEEGAILYPDDPSRLIKIRWQTPKAKRGIRSLFIRGPGWKLSPGFYVGQTLKNIEKMNGEPFRLTGFAWDYAGTIVGWGHGKFEAKLPRDYQIFVRLQPGNLAGDQGKIQLQQQVIGDKEFSSGHQAMQALNPTVYEIVLRAKTPAVKPNNTPNP